MTQDVACIAPAQCNPGGLAGGTPHVDGGADLVSGDDLANVRGRAGIGVINHHHATLGGRTGGIGTQHRGQTRPRNLQQVRRAERGNRWWRWSEEEGGGEVVCVWCVEGGSERRSEANRVSMSASCGVRELQVLGALSSSFSLSPLPPHLCRVLDLSCAPPPVFAGTPNTPSPSNHCLV